MPMFLTKESVAEQGFNSSYHKNPVDFRAKAQQFSYLLNDLDKVETFLFFTDPHLAEFSGWESRFREFLAIIQQYYNSTPTSFCLCGGDWLGNSDLSNQSSETLVFSRKIGILILVPYVFSLVFALMSRNKGNFLFRLPRPPYQAVLRKFVSLLS